MIRRTERLEAFERQYVKERWNATDFQEALGVFEAMWVEARRPFRRGDNYSDTGGMSFISPPRLADGSRRHPLAGPLSSSDDNRSQLNPYREDDMKTHLTGLPLLLIFVSGLAGAQGGAQDARPEDVSSIDGIINAYYEVVSGPAGEAPDAARDRSLHHPDAWVAIAGADDAGNPAVTVMSLDDYYGDNEPRAEGFWEWETDRVIQRSGNMVHVWSSYATARTEGGEPYGHGVNSITLFHDGTRWWIMGWMYDDTAG